MNWLDDIYHRVRENPVAQRFTFMNRWLLAAGFIPTGLVKVLNQPFTTMSAETPVGLFFEVFYSATEWYIAVGVTQIVAGILLLIPAFAHVGAFLFLPVILNILLITLGMGFKGTPIVVALMLLANLWLIAWEYPRIKRLIRPGSYLSYTVISKWEGISYVIGVSALFLMMFATRGMAESFWMKVALGSGALALLIWVSAMLPPLLKRSRNNG